MTTSTSSLNSPSTGTQPQTRSVSDVRRHPWHEHRSLGSDFSCRSLRRKDELNGCMHLNGRRRDRFLHLRVFVCLHASEMLRCASESSEESRKMLYMGSVSTMSGYFSAETPDKLVDGMQGINDYEPRSIFDCALPEFIAWFEGDSGQVDLILSCPPPAQHARVCLAAERIADAGTGRLGEVRQVPLDRAAERRTRVTRRSRLRRVDHCAARVFGLGRVDGAGRRSQMRALQVRILHPVSLPFSPSWLTSEPPCRILQPEYAQIAKQWSSAKKNDDEEHIFAYLDFEKGPEIFQRVGPDTPTHASMRSRRVTHADCCGPRNFYSWDCKRRRLSSSSCRRRVRERLRN